MGLFQNPWRIARELTQYGKDADFIERNWDMLMNAYRGTWIAVRNGKVLGSSPDYDRLCLRFGKKLRHAAVRLMAEEPPYS